MLIFGIVITLVSFCTFLWPNQRVRAVEKRIAQGDDHFFEEQRSYRAYPYLRSANRVRIAGSIGTLCGLMFCALQFYRPW
jgi:hypothetical protein